MPRHPCRRSLNYRKRKGRPYLHQCGIHAILPHPK
nr:MAG TPA: hypothetical protein [Caudoviricetes sp.]